MNINSIEDLNNILTTASFKEAMFTDGLVVVLIDDAYNRNVTYSETKPLTHLIPVPLDSVYLISKDQVEGTVDIVLSLAIIPHNSIGGVPSHVSVMKEDGTVFSLKARGINIDFIKSLFQ